MATTKIINATNITGKLAGYDLQLDLDADQDGGSVTQCYISWGRYSASLECLQATGCLDHDGVEFPVRPSVIDAIQQWADKYGYSG